jgi:hypothetical protein
MVVTLGRIESTLRFNYTAQIFNGLQTFRMESKHGVVNNDV